jgi:3-methyladenine DNA glycosylase/8-oxoguanine DNA glycosylase
VPPDTVSVALQRGLLVRQGTTAVVQPAACQTSLVLERRLPDRPSVDLALTLGPLWKGSGDPTMRLARHQAERAGRGPEGAYGLRIWRAGSGINAAAWGPGASWALAHAPALLGLDDDTSGFDASAHPLVARLARGLRGLRIGRTGAVLEALLPAILEQKITGAEASRAYRGIIARYGEPAPGPLGLRLHPEPGVLAAIPYADFHPLGVERRRAELIRRVAADAARLEALVDGPTEIAAARLTAYTGIGPWTAAEVLSRAMGDPDAVSVGDYHLPNLVAWLLAGEPRADDARMLQLLEPWRGHRARVIRLLEASGLGAPRYGPRMPSRAIEAI